MAKAVARPIPLRAGRWSIHQQSRGNFVYSFNDSIPFDYILSYEHILLAPFQGSGQLCPSLGWMHLLIHGMPVMNNDNTVFGPDALFKEVCTLLGLKRSFFSMPPRWLKPIEHISFSYSSITFALSDPDGSATSTLLKGWAALFGKEVTVQKWINKPALVQCLHCHALGHIKTFRACPLGKNSVRCFICGGTHPLEEHNQKCPKKHTVAGNCNCKHYKCLNCQGLGHHCKDPTCSVHDLFHPNPSCRAGRTRNKGKGIARAPAEQAEQVDLGDDGDLYAALPPLLNAPNLNVPTPPLNQEEGSTHMDDYLPSHLQGSATAGPSN
jgi:hypothetical protein